MNMADFVDACAADRVRLVSKAGRHGAPLSDTDAVTRDPRQAHRISIATLTPSTLLALVINVTQAETPVHGVTVCDILGPLLHAGDVWRVRPVLLHLLSFLLVCVVSLTVIIHIIIIIEHMLRHGRAIHRPIATPIRNNIQRPLRIIHGRPAANRLTIADVVVVDSTVHVVVLDVVLGLRAELGHGLRVGGVPVEFGYPTLDLHHIPRTARTNRIIN